MELALIENGFDNDIFLSVIEKISANYVKNNLLVISAALRICPSLVSRKSNVNSVILRQQKKYLLLIL